MNTSIRGSIAAAALCALLAACGGSDTPPTTLPPSVAISNVARADAGATVTFKTDLPAADGLTFRWDFGDGSTGAGATASHAYAKTGTYQVTVAVANDAEDLRTATSSIQVGTYANVAGLNCTQSDSAGWCWQHALVTGHQINDVFFVDATHAWAVGDDLTILKSADAGATWTPVAVDASIAPASLRSVRFYDASHGMALTDQGTALQTSDGGATWTFNALSTPGFYPSVNAFVAYDANRIILQSSPYGAAIVSTDGGSTWTPLAPTGPLQATGPDCWSFTSSQVSRYAGCGATATTSLVPDTSYYAYQSYFAAAFPSQTQALVLDNAYTTPTYQWITTAWATADGGATWSNFQPAGLPTSFYATPVLSMSDAQNGLLVASDDSAAYVTSDGGHDWSTIAGSAALSQVSSSYRSAGVAAGSVLWEAIGNHVSISVDRGQTWNDTVVHGEDAAAASGQSTVAMVQYRDANDFVVSIGHRFYATQDAGKTYTRLLGPDSRDAAASSAAGYFFDAKTGKFLTSNGALLSTADGGRTWTRSDYATTSNSPVALQFLSATEGFLLLNGELSHSTDAGATWNKPLVPSAMAGLQGMSWGDATHGWTWNYNALFATTDAGVTWTPVALPASAYGVSSAVMTGALTGVVSSGGTTRTTQDGGATWQTSTSSGVYGTLVRTQGQTVWALSNASMRSKDGGRTWQAAGPASSGSNATALSFADDLNGWMLTSAGNVLHTIDGGDTWSSQPVGTDLALQAVVAVDAMTAWIITRDGQILSTATAGN